MENFLKPYNLEYMRMAILKHEETFKEQVYELHRLYRIQTIMMRNIESNRPDAWSQELRSSKNGFSFHPTSHACDMQQKSMVDLDLETPTEDYVTESNACSVLERIDESEIQLTLRPSSYSRRKKPGTLSSDSVPSLSSSSTGSSSHINRTNSMAHQMKSIRSKELSGRELLLFEVPDLTMGCLKGSKNSIGVEEQLRQERVLKQPTWLLKVLSLNTS